jgi:hypothetical protein
MRQQATTFSKRKVYGEQFSEDVFKNIQEMGFTTALNGTEHTHSSFIKNLRMSEDQTSMTIRYQPDGVIAIGEPAKSAYVEAKASSFIERNAYKQYMRLVESGCIVAIVFRFKDEWLWNFADNMVFKDSSINNSRHKFPVIDGWVCPRQHPNWRQIKSEWRGSGTPYRIMDENNAMGWNLFKPMMLNALSQD